ncbi:hypothetical protein [Streptomyces calidiresistens]|nr:hypothetical protein [Streptomyces calidiresistens]
MSPFARGACDDGLGVPPGAVTYVVGQVVLHPPRTTGPGGWW